MNSIASLENLLRDIRYAGRTLVRSPGYTLMAALTLGLGIGANPAIFTVLNGVLMRPLPYASPNQITHPQQRAVRVGTDPIGFSVQEVQDYRDQSNSFSENIGLNWTKYAEQTTQNTFFRQIVDRAQQIPGTENAFYLR